MQCPPEAQTRRAGSGKPTPKRKFIESTDNIYDDVTTRQAARVAKLYLVSFELASAIACLAWGVAR